MSAHFRTSNGPPYAAVQAEALQNYQLYVALADRGPLRDPDEFYAQDLIGCRVLDQVGVRTALPPGCSDSRHWYPCWQATLTHCEGTKGQRVVWCHCLRTTEGSSVVGVGMPSGGLIRAAAGGAVSAARQWHGLLAAAAAAGASLGWEVL